MRLVFVLPALLALLAPTPAGACEDEGEQVAQRQDQQARARHHAQRDAMRQARRAAERAQRDLERARREAGRGRPLPQSPQAGPQPVDPYAYQDPKDTKDKLDKLQKKLDKLRDRLGKFQVPKKITTAKPMKLEIQRNDFVIDVNVW